MPPLALALVRRRCPPAMVPRRAAARRLQPNGTTTGMGEDRGPSIDRSETCGAASPPRRPVLQWIDIGNGHAVERMVPIWTAGTHSCPPARTDVGRGGHSLGEEP